MKSTENQVKELLTSHEEASESQIKVIGSFQFKSGKFESLEKKFKKEDEQINQSEKKHWKFTRKTERLFVWHGLVLHGVNKSKDENTDNILIKRARSQNQERWLRQKSLTEETKKKRQ